MSEQKQANEGATTREPGDVETAGETTAADTVSGPDDKRPVGTGTTAPVEGDENRPRRPA